MFLTEKAGRELDTPISAGHTVTLRKLIDSLAVAVTNTTAIELQRQTGLSLAECEDVVALGNACGMIRLPDLRD